MAKALLCQSQGWQSGSLWGSILIPFVACMSESLLRVIVAESPGIFCGLSCGGLDLFDTDSSSAMGGSFLGGEIITFSPKFL